MGTGQKLSKYQIHHIEHVKNHVAKAIHDYAMISKGERVLAAISGGKDSLVMLEALSVLRKYDFFEFELEALHIDVTDVPYQADREKLEALANDLSVKLHVKQIEVDLENRGKKSPCFVCSWHRRKALFEFANENGFTKLAFGHHMDDAVETLLINMAYHGNISSIPGKLSMFSGAIHAIRPLILLTNKDTAEFARIRHYPDLTAECPFENETYRKIARDLLADLETLHPKARWNLFNSMGNIDEDYLP